MGDMPTDYSSTPGGTIFGTTPGGTKIVYERAFLVNMRNSPLSRTPPTNLPNIPGVTSDLGKKEQKLENHIEVPNKESEQNGDDQSHLSSTCCCLFLHKKFPLQESVSFKSQVYTVPNCPSRALNFFLTCCTLHKLVSRHSF